ncbi:MAG: hypothetical protein DBX39_03220 [Bacillota bacterium]|nr:MAG: hypothetical protein DBX39_03220 [Bacillota bacterium]
MCFVLAGIIGKIVGCGGIAKLCRYSWKESAQIGCGMIARGEVALVVCNKGIEGGLFAGTAINPVVPVIMLVILSSLLCPVLLKLLFKNDNRLPLAPDQNAPALSALPDTDSSASEQNSADLPSDPSPANS